LDLSKASVDQKQYPLNRNMVSIPAGAEIKEIYPMQVNIELEQAKEIVMPIEANIIGELQEGFLLKRVEVIPAEVLVRGPESKVLDTAKVRTTPVDISLLTQSTEIEAELILPDDDLRLVGADFCRKGSILTMEKLFGTDGIRATAGEYPLDYNSVYTLGYALIELLRTEKLPPRVIIGRDTRESGQGIEQALFQGIEDSNGEAVSAGLIPTSAISFLTKRHGFSAGIVISASHNPYQDNGIKIFSAQGIKIANDWEGILERAIIESDYSVQRKDMAISSDNNLSFDYVQFLKSRFEGVRLPRKIKIVLDCANGASSHIAPMLFSDLGFDILAISASPDGVNINKGCGSLCPENLSKKVVETGADIGVAFDGDADRVLWVDERGRILNGDHTLFVLARFMKEKDRLKTDTVVATTMSNMGLEKGLGELGLKLVRTQVGDKYVLEEMMKLKANLGGETQSESGR
jgi:phosphoglucosamine mutase